MRANHKKSVNRLIIIQITVCLVVASLWCLLSLWAGLSAMIGGLVCIVSNLLFSFGFLANMRKRDAATGLQLFYLGEFCKMLLSVTLIMVAVLAFQISVIPVLTGFLLTTLGLVGVNR